MRKQRLLTTTAVGGTVVEEAKDVFRRSVLCELVLVGNPSTQAVIVAELLPVRHVNIVDGLRNFLERPRSLAVAPVWRKALIQGSDVSAFAVLFDAMDVHDGFVSRRPASTERLIEKSSGTVKKKLRGIE